VANAQLRSEEPNLLKQLVHYGKVALLFHAAMRDYTDENRETPPESGPGSEAQEDKPCGLEKPERKQSAPQEKASMGRRPLGPKSAALIDRLLDLSKCPDFVVNGGHVFGSTLTEDEKLALIEFLKTF